MFPRRIQAVSFLAATLMATVPLIADENQASRGPKGRKQTQDDDAQREKSRQSPEPFVLSDDVKEALVPLFSRIAKADVSRVTVELAAESVVDGAVAEARKSTYQIASIRPDKFTIYLKEPDQQTRIYNDGQRMTVALAPDAYYRMPDAIDTQRAVNQLPVPMGPYPEPVLALSLAGVDPSVSFLGGMKSVEIVDRGKFRGKVPAIHLHGVQDDAVTWDLWITKDDEPKPLRLRVDLTEMLKATGQVTMPRGYEYQLRFDFLAWRMTGKVDERLFSYQPPKDATQYESLSDYYESIAEAATVHPLLGKKAPAVKGVTADGKTITSDDFEGKIVILDFWATWCEPCMTALPIIDEVAKRFANQDVVFFAVNVGEEPAHIRGFVEGQEWGATILLDPEGEITQAFSAKAIPLTIVIGKNGIVESTHVGFAGPDGLRQRLVDELEVLGDGGRIASATSGEASE